MSKAAISYRAARFEGFELDLRAGELHHNGDKPVALAEQPFRILVMLLERPKDVVSREEIRSALWPNGTVVEFDHSISAAMNRLRQVLGDSAGVPRFIETLARRGYRWKTSVEWIENGQPQVSGSNDAAREAASPETHSPISMSDKLLAAGVIASLLLTAGGLWLARSSKSAPSAPREFILQPLTTNSFENRVTSGAISPDGKYLTYSDTNSLYVKVIATGETRTIPEPDEFRSQTISWECASWFPDSTQFVVNAHRSGIDSALWSSEDSSLWIASTLGAVPRKLRDAAMAYSVSPDGSLISFGTNKGKLGDREIWLMHADGGQARKLIDSDAQSAVSDLNWSADGKRVLYQRTNSSGASLLVRALDSSDERVVLPQADMKSVDSFRWLNDGRLLLAREETVPAQVGGSCNLWEMRLDPRTDESLDKPSRLTSWSGFCMGGFSQTSDGRQLAFLKSFPRLTSYLASVSDGGKRISTPRHFPLSESSEAVNDWAGDSRTIFLISNRTGKFGIYKQKIDQDVDEPLVTEGYGRNPRVAPDGKYLVYLGIGKKGPWPARGPEPVMRVPTSGGPSQELFVAATYSLLTCPRAAGNCVIGEPTGDGKQLIVTAFDAEKGRGAELFRFDLLADDDTWWLDISPEGTRVALLRTSASPIYIYSLQGQLLREIRVKGWSNFTSLIWAADGNGFFAAAALRNSSKTLHIDLQGNALALWEISGSSGETLAHPSPDGSYVFLDGWNTSGNLAIIKDF